ncbi:MAG: DUF3025 domain-containing protein [Burkholderiales bacterium]|nr:DUF3025 domain-containing protein [Burkholderiales bacterium]
MSTPVSSPAWPHSDLIQSPWFTALHATIDTVAWSHFPDQLAWDNLLSAHAPRNAQDLPIRFDLSGVDEQSGYEQRIWETGTVATRPDNWHDAFNALCWLAWPKTKAALNALHIRELAEQAGPVRSRLRDAATLFDESGLVLACADNDVAAMLKAHDWHAAFVTQRASWGRTLAPLAIGHALLEKGLAPFKGIVARTMIMPVEPSWFDQLPTVRQAVLDDRIAQAITIDAVDFMHQLQPLPVLGIPGWWPVQDAAFYADQGHFRPKRSVVRRV